MKTRILIITGIVISFTTIFFVLGPSQGHIAEYFLTDEQFEEMILDNDNTYRYFTYEDSLAILFSPLNLENIELSFDWCIENNGFWNEGDSTCYFENQEDLDAGMIAVQQYGEKTFGNIDHEYYPFGLLGPVMNQETCDRFVISQWQPTIEGKEKTQKFLEICIQRGFMTPELVERGKVADNFTTGTIQSAKMSAKGDIEKTIEILEEMYKEATIKNLEDTTKEDYFQSIVHVDVDKEEYRTDDVIIISGYVKDMIPDTELNIIVRNPLLDTVFVSQVKIFEDGTFAESLLIGGPLWKQNGMYSVYAQYGKAANHTDFLYLSDLESDDLL